ncbi:centromere-associated protein E-like [Palaemon carinicauda]|uniref:centromere-associated protein E-like n=1 Tax=Palaemon carinicauda TaxID=392227 RepID=UPI0035B62D30
MSDNILVSVRLRPLIPREINDNLAIHWRVGEDNTLVQVDPVGSKALCPPYRFDRVFGMDYDNADIFFSVAAGIVESALAGFNGTIFAYGQTSSGKTHTMMGDKNNPGVIPLAIQNIFNSIENNPNREYLIRVSFMEIYNEAITDLLATRDPKTKGLSVREDASGAVYVVDLKEECVNSEEMLLSLLRKGNKNRHVGATNMNDKSSRSHTIFRLIIESRERNDSDDANEAITVSHLNLVDLAGSENASQTGATGERLKEGGFINKSLFMLGRVISQLSEGEQFVNFRDSKLTRILQSSLGGNAKTAIVCTVTPVGIDQTHSTLRFASRAKSIKNKPIINEVLSEAALLKRYAKEIKNLQLSLDKERNTDKAQEVEQVREMLDEKERINQELLLKINDLKTKLIVSSHPREIKIDKKKKLRRETWAAPRALRGMRMSMAPVNIEPVRFDSNFLEPRVPLPLLAGFRKISEESGQSEESDPNISALSDGFGREVSFTNDLAEQSKLEKLENSMDSLDSSSHKPWKRVHFKIPHQGDTVDTGCQTEDSLVPQFKVPLQPHTPGTPTHILRLRNKKLMEEVSKKEEWLNDWEKEMKTLAEYHSTELAMLDESFQRKMAEGPLDYEKLEEKEREIKNLQHSLSDSEALLLDANRSLSEKKHELSIIQGQLQDLLPKSSRLTEVEKELTDLRNKYEETLKILDKKEERLSQLENDRKDFDMMMELALEKQRVKEKDLRKSLDDAWREIAEHEKGNVEEVKNRHKRMTILEAELTELRTLKSDVNPDELKKQLQDALAKQQEYEDQLKEQSIQLSQVLVLEEKVKKMETQVSEIEILKTELYKAEDLAKMFEKENSTLKNDIELLQSTLTQKEGSHETKRIQELELEVELLREKLEGVENADSTLGISPSSQPNSSVTSKISRKLSETLQVLEESMMIPTTPGTNSTSFCEPYIQPHDVAAIKQQLLNLQAALVAQELQYQNQKDQQDSFKDALLDQMICTEIMAKAAAEIDLWKLTESFYVDFISHSTQFFDREMATPEDKFQESIPNMESTGVFNINEEQNTVAETTIYKDAYDTKFTGNRSTFEGGSSQESTDNNTFYTSVLPSDDGTTSSASMEMTLNDCFDISILDTMSVGNEHMSLKEQLKILREEKSNLVSQVKHLQNKLDSALERKPETLGSVFVESPENSVLQAFKPRHGALSLADELLDAGVNSRFCNDTFETSVFEMEVNPVQENETLKQQLELLSSENVSLQNKILELQMQSSSLNNSNASGDASTPLPVSQHDLNTMGTEMKKLQSEKSILELEVQKLKDELSMVEEEVHSLRWQVETLKEENSHLEEDIKIYESEASYAEASMKEVVIDEVSQQGKLINKEEVLAEKLTDSECKSSRDYDESVSSEEQLGNQTVLNEEQLGKQTVYSEEELQSSTSDPGQQVEEIGDLDRTCEKLEEKSSKTASETSIDSQADNNELESIKANLNVKVKLLEELEIHLEKVKEDLVEKTRELAENKVKFEDLRAKEEELFNVKNELEIIKISHSDKLKIIEELEKNHEQLKEELDVKAKELDGNKAMIEDLEGKEKELEEVKNELEFIKTSHSDKVKVIEEREKGHEQLKEELDVKAKELAENKVMIEDLNGKKKELNDAKNELEVIKMDMAHKVELLGEVEKNVEQLKESLAVKARELEENLVMTSDLKSKEEELDNVKKELEDTKTDLKLKVKELEGVENNFKQLKEDLDVKTIELVETKAMIEVLREKESELESIKADLCHKGELLREVEKNCEELRENLLVRTKTLEETKSVLEDLQEKHSNENSDKMSSPRAEESELALAQEKIQLLEQELETQKKITEEKIASIIDEKESELEGIITNFMEKEEAFEKRINTLVEVEKKASTKDEVEEDLGQKCSSLQVIIENLESTLVMKGADLLALEETCQKIQSCLSDATEQLDVYKEKCSAQMSEMEALRKTLEEKENIIKITEEEKQKLVQDLDEVKNSLDEQKIMLKEQEEKLKQSCDQLLDAKNNSMREKDDSERNHILGKLDEFEKLKDDLETKVLECNELKDSLYNLKTLKNNMEEKLAQAIEEHKLEIAFYSEDLEKKASKIQLLEVEVKEKSDREMVMNVALEAEENKIKRLEKEVEEMKNSKEKFIMENEHMMENAQLETSQKVKELEVEIERLTKLSDELSEDRKIMIETINTKEQSSKDLLTTYDSLKSQLESLQDEHDRLKKLYDDQNSDMLVKSERTSLLEKEFDELKQIIQDLTKERTKLQNDLEVQQTEVTRKAKDIQVLESEVENMKSEVLDLNSRIKTMKNQLEEKSSNIEQLVAIIEKFETDIVMKDNQLTEAAKWENEALTNEERVKSLQGEMETQNVKLSELEKSVKDLHKENEDLKKMNSKMEKDALNSKRLTGEIRTLEEKLDLAEKSLGEVQSQLDLERRQYEKELSSVACEKIELIDKLKVNEEELTKVMLGSRNGIEEMQKLKDELEEKKQEISKLSSELDSLKEKLTSLMDISKASEQKILQQNVEIQSLKESKMLQEKEFKEIHNSNSQKIDGLVKIIEKLESDISLKQDEMITRNKEHAIEIANKSEEVKSLISELKTKTSKLAEAEESLKSLCSEKTELSQKLSEDEKQLSDFKLKSINSNTVKDIESVLAENKDLAIKLLKTEEQLKTVKEDLESKREECSRLETEMDEMIEHFRMESKDMTDSLFSCTQDLEKTKTELKETKIELSSKSQLVVDTSSSDSLVADKSVRDDVVKALREELALKEKKCAELDKEMDDIVEHYRVEIQDMNETLYSQTENIQKLEAALKETKEKLSHSHMTINTSSSDTLVADKSINEDLVKTLREELYSKEQECIELNKEMDEMVEHFNKETKIQEKDLEEMSEKLEKTKLELSQTHSRLHELTLTRGNLSTKSYTESYSHNDTVSTEYEQLIQQRANLEKEIASLKNKYAKLEEEYSVMEKNCSDLKKSNVVLQEEVKIGSTTTDSLLERLGDFEKLKAIWSEEKESLSIQIDDYKKEIAVLRKSISSESAGEQIDSLLHKIKVLEKELEVSNKNLENLSEECSGWKHGYTKQFEACEKLKEKVKDSELKMQQHRIQSEEKMEELTTRLNTVLNKSSLNSSSADVSMGKSKGKVAVLQKQKDELMEEVAVLTAKNEQLKSHLENLRNSSGIFSSNEEFNLELSLIKEKLVEIEKERDLLNRNYDMLEKENEALKEENELLASKTPVTGGTSHYTLEQLQRENAQLQVEIALLKKTATIKSEEMKAETDSKLPLEDRFVELERENSELRFRLRALNAPAEKEVQALKEALSNANAKVTQLGAELRRIQNSNNVDSTICEIRGGPVRSKLFDMEEDDEAASGNNFNYSSKSGIVSEVQVMILQNKLYSLENEKKKLEIEHRTMEQHVEHYRTKAQEWKDTSMKKQKIVDKTKKEVESWRTETYRLRKEVEDCQSEIERLQFEIGGQRQILEKIEREKRGESQLEKESGSRCSVSTNFRTPKPVPLKDQGSDKIAAIRAERMSEPVSHLRNHNADVPCQTRTEEHSADMTPSNPQKTAGNKEPLWYSAYKENKDYSKYKLPPGSSQKKKEEECKTQ